MLRTLCISIFISLLPIFGTAKLPEQVTRCLDSLVAVGLRAGYYPGASLVVGNSQGITYEKQYGKLDYTSQKQVKSTDLYDIASCTKVMSTTFALMWLYDRGKVTLEKRIDQFLPDYRHTPIGGITLIELLTHTSGIPASMLYPQLIRNSAVGTTLFSNKSSEAYPYRVERNLYRAKEAVLDSSYFSRQATVAHRPLTNDLWVNSAIDTLIRAQFLNTYKPSLRGKYRYSDANFYLLMQLIEAVSGHSLHEITRTLYTQLGAQNTGYHPLSWKSAAEIAPTEVDYLLDRRAIRGVVHDEMAALSGGVGGNAGLFSTASDMARFCELILNRGIYNGTRILSTSTVDRFISQPLASKGIYRALGFDSRRAAPNVSLQGVGHTGFTGTIFWISPQHDCYMVFLSNSVHPTRLNSRALSASMLRVKLWEVIYSSSPTALH